MKIIVDGTPIEAVAGQSVLAALLNANAHPTGGGCLCCGGDCPHCLATVNGISYVRTCQVTVQPGQVIDRHHYGQKEPPLPETSLVNVDIPTRHVFTDTIVIGGGESGQAAAAEAKSRGRDVVVLDANAGQEAIGIYAGPMVVARTGTETLQIRAKQDVIVATGAAEIHPVAPGNMLAGIYTQRGAETLARQGVDLGTIVAIGAAPKYVWHYPIEGTIVRFEGDEQVTAVVVEHNNEQQTISCDGVSVALGFHPRNALARQGHDMAQVRAVGDAAQPSDIPPCPTAGIVCPCSGITVDDLEYTWDSGFRELELVKRSTLAGTGTCQGACCIPYLRSFLQDKGKELQAPFTARPVTKQLTIEEIAAGAHFHPMAQTALHAEHLALGAQMERSGSWWRPWNYGNERAEYWAVREAVSIMDVSTLGKMILTGPDALEFLQRIYPTNVKTIKPGRSRYVLMLNDRGYVFDDGLIANEGNGVYALTFTSGGSSNSEMFLRDRAETYGMDIRLVNRTWGLSAINVTGPFAPELLARLGATDLPKWLEHKHIDVAGIACHAYRLSFTGEWSVELHHAANDSVKLWRALLDAGQDLGIRPHGLETLRTLRLEKGHIIVGMDTGFDGTPRRIHHNWAVNMKKKYDFVGRPAILRTNKLEQDKELVGMTIEAEEAPIEGQTVYVNGEYGGYVTSSAWSPLLRKAVMLVMLDYQNGELPMEADIGGYTAQRVSLPFYDKESARARA